MTANEFDTLLSETIKGTADLLRTKGADYASDSDRLSNFKNQAEKLGLTPYQVWAVYANKHWDAINAFVKNNGQLESEPIETRLYDIINYSFLLLGLIKDASGDGIKTKGLTKTLQCLDPDCPICHV